LASIMNEGGTDVESRLRGAKEEALMMDGCFRFRQERIEVGNWKKESLGNTNQTDLKVGIVKREGKGKMKRK